MASKRTSKYFFETLTSIQEKEKKEQQEWEEYCLTEEFQKEFWKGYWHDEHMKMFQTRAKEEMQKRQQTSLPPKKRILKKTKIEYIVIDEDELPTTPSGLPIIPPPVIKEKFVVEESSSSSDEEKEWLKLVDFDSERSKPWKCNDGNWYFETEIIAKIAQWDLLEFCKAMLPNAPQFWPANVSPFYVPVPDAKLKLINYDDDELLEPWQLDNGRWYSNSAIGRMARANLLDTQKCFEFCKAHPDLKNKKKGFWVKRDVNKN